MKAYIINLKTIFRVVKSSLFSYVASTVVVSMRNLLINMLNAMLFSSIAYAARIRDLQTLKISTIRFLLLLVIFVVIDTLSLHVQALTIHNMMVKIRQVIYKKFLRIPIKNVRVLGTNTGDILSRLNSDIDLVSEVFSLNILNPMMIVFSGIGGSICIYKTSHVIWIYLVILGSGAFLVKFILAKKVYNSSKQKQLYFSQLMTILHQLVVNFPNIRLMNMTIPVTQWVLNEAESLGLTLNKQALLNTNVSFSSTVVDSAAYIGVTVIGLAFVQIGAMNFEQILFIIQLANMVTDMFQSLGDSLVTLKRNVVGIERITEIMMLQEEKMGEGHKVEFGDGVDEFNTVDLSIVFDNGRIIEYPKELHIPCNKMTAIYGDSGCGKSTLGRLLVGMISDYNGEVYYLGQPLKSYSLTTLRQSITYVPQKDYFINGTIMDNLLLGNEQRMTSEQVMQVVKVLGCESWICSLSGGYNHTISYGGASISGGQRQILSIIRAVLRNSRTIILDESFSNVDTNTIPVIINGLKKLQQSIIIITHNREIIKYCDNKLNLTSE